MTPTLSRFVICWSPFVASDRDCHTNALLLCNHPGVFRTEPRSCHIAGGPRRTAIIHRLCQKLRTAGHAQAQFEARAEINTAFHAGRPASNICGLLARWAQFQPLRTYDYDAFATFDQVGRANESGDEARRGSFIDIVRRADLFDATLAHYCDPIRHR